MLFDGRNGGTVELLDNVLVIRRQGLGSFLTQGMKGDKRIPYSSIASVQFKEAGFTTGYIQFGIVGGIESRGGVWEATTDENTVLFTKEAADDFRRLRDIVEERAAAARNPRPAPPPQGTAPAGIADELGRLADLRDRGVLTPSEFDEQKARLLANPETKAPPAPGARASPVRELRRSAAAEEPAQAERSNALGRTAGIGCLVLIAIYLLFSAIGAQLGKSATEQAGTASAAR